MKTMILCIILGIVFAVIIALVGLSIYVWTTYGDKNITEIPYWALVIMGK